MKRGRKPMYLCPHATDLRRAIALHDSLADVCRHYGVTRKTLYRWMTECAMQLPTKPKMRPRGITPRYVRLANLVNGKRKACKLYMVWDGMWARCIYPRANSYHTYGGKGVRVCLDWEDYGNFRAWAVANGFRKGLTLDRIDSDGNYEPSNCRWTDAKQQQWTTCRTIHLSHNGVTRPLPQWAALMGVTADFLRSRHTHGWTDEEIITTPKGELRPGMLRGRAATKAKLLRSLSSLGERSNA